MRVGDASRMQPDDNVHKFLLSTPAHFVGEYATEDLLLSLAWPPFYSHRMPSWFGGGGGAVNRTPLVVAIRTEDEGSDTPSVIPNYENAGEVIASTLSVLFGKRFDVHGLLEASGYFRVPDLSTFTTPCNPNLKFNDGKPRANRGFPLNLSEFRNAKLLLDADDHPRYEPFHSAARFYRRALVTVEADPEEAYLNLITAGEIIANNCGLSAEEKLTPETLGALARIESEINDGKKITSILRPQLRGVKRGFISAILGLLDDSFFDNTEAKEKLDGLRKESCRDRLGAAYDLRSRFIHSGFPFGFWVALRMSEAEVPFGTPGLQDATMAKTLAKAPLFSGLERTIRYALLSFAAGMGANVEPYSVS